MYILGVNLYNELVIDPRMVKVESVLVFLLNCRCSWYDLIFPFSMEKIHGAVHVNLKQWWSMKHK
jgi:hypothetical protein